jgi:hypothetical protein
VISTWRDAALRGDVRDAETLLAERAGRRCARYGRTISTIAPGGASLDRSPGTGSPRRMLALMNGHAEVVRVLVEAGADLSVRGTGALGFAGKTALQLARAARRTDIVRVLRDAAGSYEEENR